MSQLSLLSSSDVTPSDVGRRMDENERTRAAQARAQVDRHPLAAVRSYDPVAAQAEMLAAAERFFADLSRRLAGMTRKDDPDAYDRARADVRSAKDAIRSIKTFGPDA
jgi:hypothetical protein